MAVKASAGYSPYPVLNFSGGMATRPAQDSESELFQNWEILRNGQAMSRLGAAKLNSSAMLSTEPRGMSTGVAGAGAGATYLVVCKAGATWHAIEFDPTEYGQWRALAQGGGAAFTSVSTPYNSEASPIQIETMSAGKPALFCDSGGTVTSGSYDGS